MKFWIDDVWLSSLFLYSFIPLLSSLIFRSTFTIKNDDNDFTNFNTPYTPRSDMSTTSNIFQPPEPYLSTYSTLVKFAFSVVEPFIINIF